MPSLVDKLSGELVRSVLDSSPDAMVLVDSRGHILFANQQLSTLFGYEREEIRGQPIEVLMPERFRRPHAGHRDGFAAARKVRPMGAGLELYGRRKDGSEFPVEISLSPIQEGETQLVAAAIRDATERKRAQKELVLAREAADRANQAKGRFLATASHDLRQPLQSLALLNGALRRLVDHPDAVEALAHQDQAIEAMSRLLNALLDISKLESGSIKPQPVDFTAGKLFEELRHEFAGVAAAKGLQLQVGAAQEWIHSDPALVGQILRNLLSNAIKYTRSGSVTLCTHAGGPEGIRIDVIDTGIGIPVDQQQLIYDEFYQVGVPTNSSRDGYGLGLSIVQRLVRLLGLKIEVHSEPGRGSVFSLGLPSGRSVPAAIQKSAPAPAVRPASAPHVLLVEDDPAVRDATRMLLKVEGYRVLTASCLAEAQAHLAAHPQIGLLVTDYHLSNGETGTQVIDTLRDTLGNRLKAVLVTGDTSSALKELQRDERLRLARKPINADELLGLMKSLLAV